MKLIFKQVTFLAIALCLLLSTATHAQFFSKQPQPLLPENEAFDVLAEVVDGQLQVNWVIAQDYYMYREQFDIQSATPGIEIGEIIYPKGQIENDPEFGEVEVYFFNALLTAPLSSNSGESQTVELIIRGQGCNKPVGVCYPPQTRNLTVQFTPSSDQIVSTKTEANTNSSKTKDADQTKEQRSFLGYILAAYFAGILLSFTPCVLPMIPILAAVIASQKDINRKKSGWLSICYVLGTVVTYAIIGWIAGAFGSQAQAFFQNPFFIGVVCLILFLLALSLFGAFKIEMPSAIQTRINNASVSTRSASVSSFTLGLISALIFGACVSPILITLLLAAIQQADPILGASIMAAMSLGMGTLLILFGFGAGWLLPKAGAWMNHIQVLFGFMIIGVAIYLIGLLSIFSTLYLWAALLICSGFYLFKVSDEIGNALITSVVKALALIALLWGCLSLIGATLSDDDNVLEPLSGFSLSSATNSHNTITTALDFQKTTSLTEVKSLLSSAKNANKPVMIDFYADWCLDCKRMERTTFKEPQVVQALEGWDLIKIDVTDTSKTSEEVKRFFEVFGPPATLFIDSNGEEHSDLRQYGYMNKEIFVNLVNKARG